MASPLPSEVSAKLHPYQHHEEITTPKGAFESRKINNGLYVRVDMPGSPKDAVKIVKYDETRTVTFTGKAPSLWPGFDSSHPRVYAGYVVLDRDPSNVKFKSQVDEGVFRLFFPRCDGSLHFLSPPRRLDDDETGQEEEEKPNADNNISFILHSPLDPFGIALSGGNKEHINTHLLSGVKGVYEHKIVPVKDQEKPLIYIRLDVPGTCRKSNIFMRNFDGGIEFGGMTFKDWSRYNEGPREYMGVLQPRCDCCKYKVVKYDTTDGVIRFLVRKSDDVSLSPVVHCNLPPATPGGDLQSATLNIIGRMPRTLDSREFR